MADGPHRLTAKWDRRLLHLEWTLAPEQLLEYGYWLAALAIGTLQAWPARYHPSTIDIVSYLDIGDAFVHGRWSETVNGYWNPLYSWILGIVGLIVRPSVELEYPMAKAVDWAIFLLALWSFGWFLEQLRHAYREAVARDAAPSRGLAIPDWAWIVGGYTLFIWASIDWITLTSNTPDMCAAALAYGAWGVILRLEREERRGDSVRLGVILAFGYFARTPMFIVAAALLIGLAFGRARRSPRPGVPFAAGLVFLLLTVPFIASISLARGHVTIGDNGKLNHAWLTNPGNYVIPNRHWQGGPPGHGVPKHPSRLIWNEPPIFEFAAPIGGTYPPWTDPSYWYEGLKYHFDRKIELASLRDNLHIYYEFFGRWWLLVVASALALAGDLRATMNALYRNARYWAPAATGLLLYLVADDLRVQWGPTPQPPARFLAAFVVLFCLTTAFSLRARTTAVPPLVARTMAVLLAVISLGSLTSLTTAEWSALTRPSAMPPWQLARGLQQAGIATGTRVAIIGSPSQHEFWARLARVQIVAEVPNNTSFWARSPDLRRLILLLLAKTGAQSVVAPSVPMSASHEGWRFARDSEYAVHALEPIHSAIAPSLPEPDR